MLAVKQGEYMNTYVLGPNAARKLKGLFAGNGKTDRRKAGTPGVAFASEYEDPFTVQWAQSVGEEGSWIIWLPSAELLVVNDEPVDVSADLDEAGGEYPVPRCAVSFGTGINKRKKNPAASHAFCMRDSRIRICGISAGSRSPSAP